MQNRGIFYTLPYLAFHHRNWSYIMKVTAFICIGVLTSAQLLLATPSYSQNEKKIISLNYSQASIKTIFNAIEKKADVVIMFEATDAIRKEKVSVAVKDKRVADILDELLLPKGIRWAIRGNIIRLYRDKPVPAEPASQIELFPQDISATPITGVVRDRDGNPLPGTSVQVKGTGKGTTTDKQGRFSLNAEVGDVLTISFIGFYTLQLKLTSNTTAVVVSSDRLLPSSGRDGDTNTEDSGLRIGQTLSFTNDSILNVSLTKTVNDLNEVVVNKGYYKEKQRLSTGSVARVDAKEIERQPVTSPLMALQGRMPGVEIVPTSGAPGSAVKIQIRGTNSLRTFEKSTDIDGNLPLYVIDGIPVNSMPVSSTSLSLVKNGFDPLSTIDPANIESIEVLKDADATSIYGSRGANGVILITTKSKKNSRGLHADVRGYGGIGRVVSRVDMLNTSEYLTMRREAIQNDGGDVLAEYNDPDYAYFYFPDLLSWDTTRYTNWQDELLGHHSNISDAQFNLSGGSDRTGFRIGGSYHKETLLYPGDFGYKRYSGNFSLNHASSDGRFNIALNTNYGIDDHHIFESQSLMGNALTIIPNAPPLYNDDGTLNWSPLFGTSTWVNPMSWTRSTHDASSHNINTNISADYNLWKGISIRLNTGFSRYDHHEVLNIPISSLDPYDSFNAKEGTRKENAIQRTSWIVEPQISFSRNLNKGHSISALAGFTAQQSRDAIEDFVGKGYTSDALLGSLAGATTITPSGTNVLYRYGAIFARIGYNYKDKYLLNLTGRRDGSSRFGPDKRFGNFGAVGAAWIFSNENFFSDQLSNVLSLGKIRASYGSTGNDQIGDSKYIKTYQPSLGTYNGQIGLEPTGLFNADYAWELTRKLEGAVELGFFNDRIALQVAYFRNRSSNQLVRYQLPLATGFSDVLANFDATVENKGWEFGITTKNIEQKNFSWSTSFNISYIRNKLVAFDDIETSPYKAAYKVGQPLSIVNTFIWTGVDPNTGLHTFKDIDGSGSVTPDDQELTKNLDTDYFGGISNNFSFYGFDVSFFMQFAERSANVSYFTMPGVSANQPRSVLDRWQKPGDITNVQKFSVRGPGVIPYARYRASDEVIEQISFIRLKTLSLSYTFPKRILKAASFRDLKLFAQAQNLFTITDFDGWDPEMLYGIPPLKIVSAGLQINL